jgi:hypothetical protein
MLKKTSLHKKPSYEEVLKLYRKQNEGILPKFISDRVLRVWGLK